jgi:hypothetical protein
LDVVSDGCPGTLKIKTTGQLFANQRIVERLTDHKELSQKLLDRLGPKLSVIAARGLKQQPLSTG